MQDLIDRQAAIDDLFELYEYQRDIDPTEAADLVRQGIYLAEKKIEQLPSAEPEIIRCGQCKYAEVADKEDAQDGYTCQFHRGSIWFSGSYCSWAERRTDEDD